MGKSGQSTLELAILIVVIVAALVSMSIYIKRAASGKLRDTSESISQVFYEPKHTVGDSYLRLDQNKSESYDRIDMKGLGCTDDCLRCNKCKDCCDDLYAYEDVPNTTSGKYDRIWYEGVRNIILSNVTNETETETIDEATYK